MPQRQDGRCCFPYQQQDRQDHDVEGPGYDQREMEQGSESPAPALQRSSGVRQDRQDPTRGVGSLSGAGNEEAQAGVGPGRLGSLPWPRPARKKEISSHNSVTQDEQTGMSRLPLLFVMDLLLPPSDSNLSE
jgi:hypothetical protein